MCCKTPYWFTLRGLKSNSPVLHGPLELVDVAYYPEALNLERDVEILFGSSYEADIDAIVDKDELAEMTAWYSKMYEVDEDYARNKIVSDLS